MNGAADKRGRGLFRPEHAKLWILVAITAVSTAAILIKLSDSHPLTIALWRLLIAWVILFPFAMRDMPGSVKNLGKKKLVALGIIGFFLAVHFGSWIWSFQYTKVSSSVLLVTTHPIFVAVASYYIFKERLPVLAILGIILSLVGSALIVGWDFSISRWALLGDSLALLGSLMAGLYILGGHRLRKDLSLPVYAFFVYGFSMLFLLIPIIAARIEILPSDPVEYLIFIGLALGPMLAGHTIYNWALKYVSPTLVSVSLLGEPVGSTILAILILNDLPWPGFYLGAPLVMLGIYAVGRYSGMTR
jgi:drug/metabolite transporter (DMT)-like permease